MNRGMPAAGARRGLVVVFALCLAAPAWIAAGRSTPAEAPAAPPGAQPPSVAVPRPSLTGAAASTAAAEPTYPALRGARPDGRVAAVHGLVLDRDVFHFELESGAFHFLQPVGGRTVGAVFLGHGTLRLSPATAAERRQLALQLGEGREFEVLTDSFEELVLLFADDTAQEIELAAPVTRGAPDPRAAQAYQRWLDRQRRDFHLNLQLRVLRDLLNTPGLTSGVFLALFQGKRLPPALVAVDPDGAGAVLHGGRLGREPSLLYVDDPRRGGVWYLSDLRAVIEHGRRPPPKPLARALHYWVATTVPRDTDLAGVTTVRLAVQAPGLRVLPIQLLPRLRIADAAYGPAPPAATAAGSNEPPPAAPATRAGSGLAAGTTAPAPVPEAVPAPTSSRAAAVIQEDAKEDGGDAAVIFPEPLVKGSEVLLRLAYRGDAVLTDAGDKNYVVEARTSWYPNLGVFAEPAPFDLEYRVPAGNQVVSVGRLVSERAAGPQSVSEWKTDGPIRVAGFNYGKFKQLARRDSDSGIDLEVYTNPGTPDIIHTINAALESEGRREMAAEGIGGGFTPQPTLGNVNTSRLAESAMADGINGGRVFTTYFGPLSEKHVAITQQSQFLFGQSWPSLIFMPYISFLDGTQRQRLGLAAAKDFVDQVGFHELSHQWWGHLVAADSYRDVWLEEGFAEFSAALAVQHTQGFGAYLRFWRRAREEIFARPPRSAVASVDAGPITQGFRLQTERSPYAYRALVYEKGAYVLHMLRMLMWDAGNPTPDHRFIAMMHDYAAAYAGRQATTADFQQVVERHMVPAMDAAGDGKMSWFFGQWVYGTEVPRYVTDLHLETVGAEVRIKGKVTQEGVSAGFRALVPIYLEFDRSQFVRVGLLRLLGNATVPVDVTLKPPKKPRGVLINARSEVLARD
ncbi:MAG TPA: M1 family aminopeptidase [Thermoanaerobaculia bacterium]|nr:M1 family aminopeptidase [Thermoanaerobaculia bacterium]